MGYWKVFFDFWKMSNQAYLNMIKRIPDGALDFKPTPENYSLKDLLLHIIQCETQMTDGARRGELSAADFETYRKPDVSTVQEIYDLTGKTQEATMKDFSNLSDDELMKPVKVDWMPEPQPIINVLLHSYEEFIHHRGQMTLYFRLLKLPPANIYDYSKE